MKSVGSTVLTIVVLFVAFAIGRQYPIPVILALVMTWLGSSYAGWYMKRDRLNITWLKLLFRSNWLIWLLPPLGFFASAATYSADQDNTGYDRTKYMFYAGVGFILSLVNSIVGTILLSK